MEKIESHVMLKMEKGGKCTSRAGKTRARRGRKRKPDMEQLLQHEMQEWRGEEKRERKRKMQEKEREGEGPR